MDLLVYEIIFYMINSGAGGGVFGLKYVAASAQEIWNLILSLYTSPGASGIPVTGELF